MPRTRKFLTRIHVWRGKVIHIGCGALAEGAPSPMWNNFGNRIRLKFFPPPRQARMEPSATPAEGYGRLWKVTEAYLRRWDGVKSGESGGHSNRPQRPLFPRSDIPDNLANIGS